MSVTPDFVGQRYKDTNTGNIWIANSTTPGDWTLEVQNMNVKWEPKTVPFDRQFSYVVYAGLPGVTSLTFANPIAYAAFDIEDADQLITVNFPNLTRIEPPVDTSSGYIYISLCAALTTISAPLLEFTTNDFSGPSNPVLSTVSCGSLIEVQGKIDFADCPTLASFSLSSLTTLGNRLIFTNCTALSSIDISALTALGNNVLCSGCALTAGSVNAILAQLVSIPTYGAGKTVDLSGGTSAAPSGQGIADKATLIGRGATVNTN